MMICMHEILWKYAASECKIRNICVYSKKIEIIKYNNDKYNFVVDSKYTIEIFSKTLIFSW